MAENSPQSTGRLVPIKSIHTGTIVLNQQTSSFSRGELFKIQFTQGFFVLRAPSLTGLRVNNVAVTEKVLEDGDQIAFGDEVFEFRLGDPGVLEFFENLTLLRHAGLFFVIIAITATALLRWSPDAHKAVAWDQTPMTSDTHQEEVKQLTLSERLLIGRTKFVVADRLLQESTLQNGNLYQAIVIFEDIAKSFPETSTPPEIVLVAQKEATQGRVTLNQRMENLKSNAISTFKAGRINDFRQILDRMMETNPDSHDLLYQWAVERQFKYQNLK